MHRALYVEKSMDTTLDREHPANKFIRKIEGTLLPLLKERFDVECAYHLSSATLQLIEKRLSMQQGYHALITHFPWDKIFFREAKAGMYSKEEFYRKLYGHSAEIVKKIRSLDAKLAIIVYTGASSGYEYDPSKPFTDAIIQESGADCIVYKTENLAHDAKIIVKNLQELINRF